MPTYRQLTKDEVLELATRLKYADSIDFAAIRKSVRQLFGDAAHKVTLFWDSHYDDENYSHRPSAITVWDAADRELVRPILEKDSWDEELHDFFRNLDFGSFHDDEDSLGEMTILMSETAGLDLPALYIREPDSA